MKFHASQPLSRSISEPIQNSWQTSRGFSSPSSGWASYLRLFGFTAFVDNSIKTTFLLSRQKLIMNRVNTCA